jgi:hypothetical protein
VAAIPRVLLDISALPLCSAYPGAWRARYPNTRLEQKPSAAASASSEFAASGESSWAEGLPCTRGPRRETPWIDPPLLARSCLQSGPASSLISVEVAPQTYLPIIGEDRDETRPVRRDMIDSGHGATGFLGNYAYHISMARGAYWPLRIGGGFIYRSHEAPPFATTDFQGRLDLFNISVKTKSLLLDFSFPSARYATDFDQYHRFTGLFTAAASYVSP